MHKDLLDSLNNVAQVSLIAAFADQRLGFPEDNVLRVFFPDIHLISNQRLQTGNFKFSSNYPDLLTAVVKEVKKLKVKAEKGDQKVFVFHIGDLLDLWRETPVLDAMGGAAEAIEDDFPALIRALTDPKLEAQFLLGNHDFDLYRLPDYRGWERRFHIPDSGNPKGIVLHGDIFDWIEALPDALQQLFVYYFAPQVSPGNFMVGQDQADRYIHRFNGSKDFTNYIQAPTPLKIGTFADPATPAPFNVSKPGEAPPERLKFLDQARELCTKANEEFNLNLGLTIIGHTHHPRIACHEDENGLFVLLDCGAWIESCCTDDDPSPIPSAHVAALSGNEVRIYQLKPEPD
jgi:UDP-2,3-diacylglucosamine pyrophosphatase LpxH